MSVKFLTSSISNSEISSIGPSRQRYETPCDQAQSNSVIFISSHYLKDAHQASSIDDVVLVDFSVTLKNADIRRYYFTRSVSSFLGHPVPWPRFSDQLSPSLPDSVYQAFCSLTNSFIQDERHLYIEAGAIVDWLMDASDIIHDKAAHYLTKMPDLSKHIFLASLTNAEFSTDCRYLIDFVADMIKSDNRRLAQSATAFLMLCCSGEGVQRVNMALDNESLPHRDLVVGIVDMVC
ncbi:MULTISPECIES: hypothetical protein [Synechococcales]|uniref:hypothetical protein n=1 Tax=Synechococcus sp. CS-1333 TaxID=2848638 RepID=UPI00223BA7AE|nr:hypothetical protein [Synechococcus sp. CS-1333]MCT0210292.1 hypothetical protein [Synechococcus sp. CS-1333]